MIDFNTIDSTSMGLKKWQNTVRPNWSGYNPWNKEEILATFFETNQAVAINKRTGKVRVLYDDLERPHGSFYEGGMVISDTGRGRVVLMDKDTTKVHAVYDFSKFPLAPDARSMEWLQNTYPITPELFVSVDQARRKLIVWSPQRKVYSEYIMTPNGKFMPFYLNIPAN